MKPSRDLDFLIAEKLMGFNLRENTLWPSGAIILPAYSTNIKDAWEVVEKLELLECVVVLQKRTYPYGESNWECVVTKRIKGDKGEIYFNHFSVSNDDSIVSAPHAICLAALRAVGVET